MLLTQKLVMSFILQVDGGLVRTICLINNCFTILDQIKERFLFFKAQEYLNLDAEQCPS